MLIKGFQKLTLLDFPEHTACTVFTSGCNMRCPFCHNALLVTEPGGDLFDEDEIFDHLKKRRGILEGVAVTGGEPLLQRDIERFLYDIKDLGYKVKLDTNGSFPERLKDILSLGLADYVAVDIKNSKEKYAETIGAKGFDITPIEKTVELLLKGNTDYEFRTTVVSGFHTKESITELCQWIKGAKRYFLQGFVNSGELIDGSCEGLGKAQMNELLVCAKKIIPSAALRGI